MKSISFASHVILLAVLALADTARPAPGEIILPKPARGGGLDTNAPMIHVDIFFDAAQNQMSAILDTNYGVPHLTPLPDGYGFATNSPLHKLTGKAYNLQYAWNPGGVFQPPAGAGVWIECLDMSPGLENYDGPGNKNENPPRPWTPIFGTAGSSRLWQWYGRMAHNAFAIADPTVTELSATFRVYFGDVVTGAPEAFAEYDDATVTLTWTVDPVTIVAPTRAGGITMGPPMIHVDIFYDEGANELQANLDTTHGIPHLRPLPSGYAFDSRSNYYVLAGKAYNFQYAWNPGGIFAPPAGTAVWIERLSSSPGLENYDGPGNRTEDPPRPYTPILGTDGTPNIWKWYGRMAHNAFAIRDPQTNVLTAEYRVYLGDEVTGSRVGFEAYDDATVTLTLTVDAPLPPLVLQCGALDPAPGTPLALLNAGQVATNEAWLMNLRAAASGPFASVYQGDLQTLTVPATGTNGGPVTNHAALGACLALQLESLAGPAGARLSFWEVGDFQPRCSLRVGERGGTNCVDLSANRGAPETDPYAWIQGRHFTVDQPGLYCLGFRLVDASTNGAGGGPLHAPSEPYHLFLQAGTTVASLAREGASVRATFGGEPGKTFYLERVLALEAGVAWETVAGPVTGASRVLELNDPAAAEFQGYYRLRTTEP